MNKILAGAISFIVIAPIINAKVKVTNDNHKQMVKDAKKTVVTRSVLWLIVVIILCIPTYIINPETLGVLYVVSVITGIASFVLISIRFKFIDKQVKKAIKSYLAEKEKKEKEQNILRIEKDKKLKLELKQHHKENKLKLKKIKNRKINILIQKKKEYIVNKSSRIKDSIFNAASSGVPSISLSFKGISSKLPRFKSKEGQL